MLQQLLQHQININIFQIKLVGTYDGHVTNKYYYYFKKTSKQNIL